MPEFAMTPLEIAAKVYNFNPARLGDTHGLVFPSIGSIATTATSQPSLITVTADRLLLALSASPSDGAAASYAGLDLEFLYGDRSFASDGKTPQFMPFAALAGRGPGPSQAGGPWYTWEVPILLARGTVLSARVRNNTAGPLTPKVIVKTVELR